MRLGNGVSKRLRKRARELWNSVSIQVTKARRSKGGLRKVAYEHREKIVLEFRRYSGDGASAAGHQPDRGATRARNQGRCATFHRHDRGHLVGSLPDDAEPAAPAK